MQLTRFALQRCKKSVRFIQFHAFQDGGFGDRAFLAVDRLLFLLSSDQLHCLVVAMSHPLADKIHERVERLDEHFFLLFTVELDNFQLFDRCLPPDVQKGVLESEFRIARMNSAQNPRLRLKFNSSFLHLLFTFSRSSTPE